MKLYLVRHGVTSWNLAHRYQGASDIPLAPEGIEQAKNLGRRLVGFTPDRVVASPLQRVRQTARFAMPDRTPDYLDELREFDFGAWEGLTEPEIKAVYPDAFAAFNRYDQGFVFPDGDPIGPFVERMDRLLPMLIDGGNETVLAFTHGGVIRHILCRALGLPLPAWRRFRVAPTSVVTLEIKGEYTSLMGITSEGGAPSFLADPV